MKKWWKRIRAALGMGLTWGIGWGLVGGFIMEGIVDPHGQIVDMWPQALAIPGFFGGAIFSMMLWLSEGRRRFDELSFRRFTGLGALGGLLMGGVGFAMLNATAPLWVRAVVLIAPTTLSAVSAAATLAVARLADRRLNARADAAELDLPASDAPELSGHSD